MQKTLVILTCALFFGAVGVPKASALDSPDIVYIDGEPCNSACQSYMAWSRQIMPMPGQPQRISPRTVAGQKSSKAAAREATRIRETGSKPAANDRSAKQAVPRSSETPNAKTSNLEPADKGVVTSDTAAAMPADAGSADGPTTHGARTTFARVTAAVAVAERITAAMATPPGLEEKTNVTDNSHRSKPPLSNDADPRIVVLMVRSQIKSVSELAGQKVAVDGKLSAAASNRVRTAIAAAGAIEVQLAKGQGRAIDRVINGDVSAVVLTLASPEAAEMFPEVAGFTILRVPLSPFPSSNPKGKP